jgi:CRISPR/Cas system endoribonuclease Cas6 (RAMP superfamily)
MLSADRAGLLAVEEGQPLEIDIVALDALHAERLSQADIGSGIEVFSIPCRVEWLACETVEPMSWYQTALEGKAEERVRVSWATPTAFCANGKIAPLPDPFAVIASWARRWDEHYPVAFGADGAKMLADAVRVRPFVVRGASWQDERTRIPAFTGAVTLLSARNAHRFTAVMLDVLSRYARFAGTGIRTHCGMGTTDVQFAS